MSDELNKIREIVKDFERNGPPKKTQYIGLPVGAWIFLLGSLQNTILSLLDPDEAAREIKHIPKPDQILTGVALVADMIVTSLDLQHESHQCFRAVLERMNKLKPEVINEQLIYLYGDQSNDEERKDKR